MGLVFKGGFATQNYHRSKSCFFVQPFTKSEICPRFLSDLVLNMKYIPTAKKDFRGFGVLLFCITSHQVIKLFLKKLSVPSWLDCLDDHSLNLNWEMIWVNKNTSCFPKFSDNVNTRSEWKQDILQFSSIQFIVACRVLLGGKANSYIDSSCSLLGETDTTPLCYPFVLH